MRKQWKMAAAGATMLCAMAAGANAGVATNAASLVEAAQQGSAVEKAADRRCWWRNGRRRCATVRAPGPRVYRYGYNSGFDYGPGYGDYSAGARPEDFPTGSTAWWRAMDAEDRGGFGDR